MSDQNKNKVLRPEIIDKFIKDFNYLLKPKFHELTNYERLLRVLMLSYIKHTDNKYESDIGWEFLTGELCSEICNAIEDDKYIEWGENIRGDDDKEFLP